MKKSKKYITPPLFAEWIIKKFVTDRLISRSDPDDQFLNKGGVEQIVNELFNNKRVYAKTIGILLTYAAWKDMIWDTPN